MVKRLRHRPLTAGSRVRIPMGSPKTIPIRPYGQAVKTPPFHGGIPGSNPGRVTNKPVRLIEDSCLTSTKLPQSVARGLKLVNMSTLRYGSIAQLGEHLPYKQGVTGSSPVTSTIYSFNDLLILKALITRVNCCPSPTLNFS